MASGQNASSIDAKKEEVRLQPRLPWNASEMMASLVRRISNTCMWRSEDMVLVNDQAEGCCRTNLPEYSEDHLQKALVELRIARSTCTLPSISGNSTTSAVTQFNSVIAIECSMSTEISFPVFGRINEASTQLKTESHDQNVEIRPTVSSTCTQSSADRKRLNTQTSTKDLPRASIPPQPLNGTPRLVFVAALIPADAPPSLIPFSVIHSNTTTTRIISRLSSRSTTTKAKTKLRQVWLPMTSDCVAAKVTRRSQKAACTQTGVHRRARLRRQAKNAMQTTVALWKLLLKEVFPQQPALQSESFEAYTSEGHLPSEELVDDSGTSYKKAGLKPAGELSQNSAEEDNATGPEVNVGGCRPKQIRPHSLDVSTTSMDLRHSSYCQSEVDENDIRSLTEYEEQVYKCISHDDEEQDEEEVAVFESTDNLEMGEQAEAANNAKNDEVIEMEQHLRHTLQQAADGNNPRKLNNQTKLGQMQRNQFDQAGPSGQSTDINESHRLVRNALSSLTNLSIGSVRSRSSLASITEEDEDHQNESTEGMLVVESEEEVDLNTRPGNQNEDSDQAMLKEPEKITQPKTDKVGTPSTSKGEVKKDASKKQAQKKKETKKDRVTEKPLFETFAIPPNFFAAGLTTILHGPPIMMQKTAIMPAFFYGLKSASRSHAH